MVSAHGEGRPTDAIALDDARGPFSPQDSQDPMRQAEVERGGEAGRNGAVRRGLRRDGVRRGEAGWGEAGR